MPVYLEVGSVRICLRFADVLSTNGWDRESRARRSDGSALRQQIERDSLHEYAENEPRGGRGCGLQKLENYDGKGSTAQQQRGEEAEAIQEADASRRRHLADGDVVEDSRIQRAGQEKITRCLMTRIAVRVVSPF